jgi:hypothetical protein
MTTATVSNAYLSNIHVSNMHVSNMHVSNIGLIAAFALVALAGTASAQDRAELDRATITGNRELPKVLTIVPWKKPLPGQLLGRPVQSLLDEPLLPLEPEVFKRKMLLHQQQAQHQAQQQPSATLPTPATPPR